MEEYSLIHPNYVSDTIKLEATFSEKIWLHIFKNISEPNHYHSICAGSPYFHELLQPLQTQILFPEVIKLCSSFMGLTDEWYFSLLQCRAVCTTWKQGVDATFHQILSESNTDATAWKEFGSPPDILSRNQERLLYQPDIYDKSKLEKFLEDFHHSHFFTGSNPFPSRAIEINIRTGLTTDNKLFNILQMYGHHIWHCYVKLWYVESGEQRRQVLMSHKVLTLLPNLQSLRINNLHYWNENTDNLERVLSENPMPKFKNLKLLINHYIPRPVSFQLIQNNPHIKKLRISKLDSSNLSELVSNPLLNLEELHILGFQSEGDFVRLLSLQNQWPLKKLTIFCHHIIPHVNSVFGWITYWWAEALTDLSISIPFTVSVSEIESPLKLPNLKTLKIQMEHFACLDFILHLSKSLESLSVYHHGTEELDDSVEKNSKIKFFSYRWNVGYSNIWKFFPRLKEIKYADKSVRELFVVQTYRRDHWENWYRFAEN